MSSTWLKSALQWILVICCAEAVSVPVAAFTCVLTPAATLQVQDERESETVAVAGEVSRRVETPAPKSKTRAFRVVSVGRSSSLVETPKLDGRAELQSRFLSLRC